MQTLKHSWKGLPRITKSLFDWQNDFVGFDIWLWFRIFFLVSNGALMLSNLLKLCLIFQLCITTFERVYSIKQDEKNFI